VSTLHTRPARPRILVVDDEIGEKDALVRLLASEGFDIRCTASGADALARVRWTQFDAMVLDLHLPDMLGLSLLSELRRGGAAVPVVAVTGWYLDGGHEEACLALGAAAFLRKPLDHSVLAPTLRAAIAAHAIPPPPARAPVDCPPSTVGRHGTVRSAGGDLNQDVSRVLRALQGALRRKFPRAAADLVATAAVDAILDHLADPHRFDPARGIPLDRFLLLPASRNLSNLLRSEVRRRLREAQYARLMTIADGNAEMIERHCDIEAVRRLLISQSDPADRAAVERWVAGDRTTGELGESMRISALPLVERRRAVKRLKARLIRLLSRGMRPKG
jgi:CheY-like chemotaxis protein